MIKTYKITIKGTVQGVGFRPFIYTLAQKYNLKGTINNNSNGVEIFINSSKKNLNDFILNIKKNHPPLSEIDTIQINETVFTKFENFKIINTQKNSNNFTNIPPDISICKECEKELFDKNNRRYLYPFITCTNCGVRYSIIYDLPYDRINTSMKFFKMCEKCKEEYLNPLNRRYHAQPISCWDCGTSLSLWDKNKKLIIDDKKIVNIIIQLIIDGHILAIKGVGGYHFICDATNKKTIQKLRKRKNRPTKPFAIMVKNINMAKKFAHINKKEEKILTSKERPIVLLNSIKKGFLQEEIAPNISSIGLFLPYTPLHLLILNKLNRPIIATSANITNEPIATTTQDIKKLSNIYDYLVEHNREIINGCDDSVLMVIKHQTVFLRRARGYTPIAINLPFKLKKKVLAVGTNQKNTIAIGFENKVILSPYIGDLNGIKSVEYFKKNINNLKRIYHFNPDIILHDKHPNYESTKYAKTESNYKKLPLKKIQHHYAHILSVMIEKKLTQKVLGVAFDGTGYGDDNNLWGGEFFICDYKKYKRIAHINYFKLLGGTQAIKEPKRVALSLLFDTFGEKALNLNIPTIKAFTKKELKIQFLIWEKGLNSPLSSSMGRLFDAIASLTDICQVISFEGESGMKMEKYYNKDIKTHYSFGFKNEIINILPIIKAIVKEDNPIISISKFFNTIVEIIYVIYKKYNFPIVLSGGVFQNRVLLELILEKIPTANIPNTIPPNDSGVSLGQVVSTL